MRVCTETGNGFSGCLEGGVQVGSSGCGVSPRLGSGCLSFSGKGMFALSMAVRWDTAPTTFSYEKMFSAVFRHSSFHGRQHTGFQDTVPDCDGFFVTVSSSFRHRYAVSLAHTDGAVQLALSAVPRMGSAGAPHGHATPRMTGKGQGYGETMTKS